jgi:hypothetical protein
LEHSPLNFLYSFFGMSYNNQFITVNEMEHLNLVPYSLIMYPLPNESPAVIHSNEMDQMNYNTLHMSSATGITNLVMENDALDRILDEINSIHSASPVDHNLNAFQLFNTNIGNNFSDSAASSSTLSTSFDNLQSNITMPQSNSLSTPFKKKGYLYTRKSHDFIEIPTVEFHQWYAKRRPYFTMERGIRILHPTVCQLDYHDIKANEKPRIMTHPFTISLNTTGEDFAKKELVKRGKIAVVATFRCNGSFDSCHIDFSRSAQRGLGGQANLRSVPKCKFMYEVKVLYSDLTKCRIYFKNSHPIPLNLI